jgi:hypothetical protein
MSAPFIVIRTFTIKEGKLEGFKEFLPEFFKFIAANEPRLLAINAYVNDDGTEASFVSIHPDAASMEHHEQVAHEQIERVRKQFLDDTTSVQVYGELSEGIVQKTKQLAANGIPLTMKPEHLGGFTRLGGTAG